MNRRFLVVDEIFGAKAKYYTWDMTLRVKILEVESESDLFFSMKFYKVIYKIFIE